MYMHCAICGSVIQRHGNDPWPIRVDGVCCDACNMAIVVPARRKMAREAEEVKQDMAPNTTVVHVTCVLCGAAHTVLVPTDGYKKWAQGRAHIQDALPGLSAEERELLMSGICPRCWDKTFGEE